MDTRASVLQPIPRRRQSIRPTVDVAMVPGLRSLKFQAGVLRSIGRLAKWLGVTAYVQGGNLWDRLRRRDSVGRRAVRLHRGLQRVGGTFIKFGQQLAMRIDVLPWEDRVELSKMLDRMPAFPVEQALDAVSRSVGRPWQDVFAVFDPEPVGAASIACVYQATLKDGTKVAVKVRRPGIGEMFMADFRAIDWLLGLVEFLSILRPGVTRGFRRELRETLLEELDFRREAHYQDVFRRNARDMAGQTFFTAPRVHFELSNDEVLVQEFASGMWLSEVIAAIEQQDTDGLEMMRQLEIEPSVVARRILWAAFWSMSEHLFFHADPHPANIVVGRENTLTFIDFGSCGTFNDEQRRALDDIALAMLDWNAEGMARASLTLVEPLPAIDVASFLKDMETEYMEVLYTFHTKAKHTQWWERTSARQWLAMVKAARRYQLPMNISMLRMVRATLLYDTLVLRLDGSINRYKEFARFRRKNSAKWAGQRWQKRSRRARRQFFLRIEELAESGEDLVVRANQTIRSPVVAFRSVVEKWAFAFGVLSRTAGRLILLTGIALGLVVGAGYLGSDPAPMSESLWTVGRSRIYQAVAFGVIVFNVREILARLTEREVGRARRDRP